MPRISKRRMNGFFYCLMPTAYCLMPTAYSPPPLNHPVQPFNFLLQHARILNENLAPLDLDAHDL